MTWQMRQSMPLPPWGYDQFCSLTLMSIFQISKFSHFYCKGNLLAEITYTVKQHNILTEWYITIIQFRAVNRILLNEVQKGKIQIHKMSQAFNLYTQAWLRKNRKSTDKRTSVCFWSQGQRLDEKDQCHDHRCVRLIFTGDSLSRDVSCKQVNCL